MMHRALLVAPPVAMMLFESWAEGLPNDAFDRWVIEPTAALIKRMRELGLSSAKFWVQWRWSHRSPATASATVWVSG